MISIFQPSIYDISQPMYLLFNKHQELYATTELTMEERNDGVSIEKQIDE